MDLSDERKISVFYIDIRPDGLSKKLYVSPNFRIGVVLEGEALWEIAGRVYRVQKNHIILLNNTDERLFKQIPPGTKLSLMMIDLKPQILLLYPFAALFKNYQNDCSPVLKTPPAECLTLIELIRTERGETSAGCDTVVFSLTIALVSYIYRFFTARGICLEPAQYRGELYKALGYIDKNYCGDITLERAAGVIPMSKSAFSKLFLRYNGIGFNQYVRRKRIEKALYLLKTTDDTVLSIALQCGFKNSANFYKAFRQIAKSTPKLYRQTDD